MYHLAQRTIPALPIVNRYPRLPVIFVILIHAHGMLAQTRGRKLAQVVEIPLTLTMGT
jgi:hypothetical protein